MTQRHSDPQRRRFHDASAKRCRQRAVLWVGVMSIQPVTLLYVLLATVAAIQLLQPVALRFSLIDTPGEIKLHRTATPCCGGLAIVMALAGFAALEPDLKLVE